MKYRFLNYDLSEYKLLEDELNRLSEQGYNSSNIDRITRFIKNNKRYYYCTDILIKRNQTPKRKLQYDMMNHYMNYDFDYCGKVGKILIFRSEQKKNPPTDNSKDIVHFFQTRKFSKIFIFIFAAFLSRFILDIVLSQNQIDQFVTNGNIILHYTFIPICLTVLYQTFVKLLMNQKAKNHLVEGSSWTHQEIKRHHHIQKGLTILLIIDIFLVSFGLILDYFDRKDIPINQDILTLSDFQLEGDEKDYPTYTKMNSFIVQTTSYAEVNEKGDALYSKCYQFHNKKDTNTYFQRYIKQETENKTVKKLDNSIYLIQSDNQYDTIIYKTDKQFVYVTTSFELYDSQLYQVVYSFYNENQPS